MSSKTPLFTQQSTAPASDIFGTVAPQAFARPATAAAEPPPTAETGLARPSTLDVRASDGSTRRQTQAERGGITPEQFGSEAQATGVASSICGPLAAIGFARAMGRSPTVAEALDIARKNGRWDASTGMYGPQAEAALLDDMGIPNRLDDSPSEQEVRRDLDNGNPVILSSPGHYHYFVATAYQRQADGSVLYDTGNTGTALKGGSQWRTWDDIGPQATLYLQEPSAHGPSTATGRTSDQPGGGTTMAAVRQGEAAQRGELGGISVTDQLAPQDFVATLRPVAEAHSAQTGIPAEYYLAAAAHESNWGNAGNNMLFGIKGPGATYATYEVEGGRDVPQDASFSTYPSADAAFTDFDRLVTGGRYADAYRQFRQDRDPHAFFSNITAAGYATDQTWGDKIAAMAHSTIAPLTGGDPSAAATGTSLLPTSGGRIGMGAPLPPAVGPGGAYTDPGRSPSLEAAAVPTATPPGWLDPTSGFLAGASDVLHRLVRGTQTPAEDTAYRAGLRDATRPTGAVPAPASWMAGAPPMGDTGGPARGVVQTPPWPTLGNRSLPETVGGLVRSQVAERPELQTPETFDPQVAAYGGIGGPAMAIPLPAWGLAANAPRKAIEAIATSSAYPGGVSEAAGDPEGGYYTAALHHGATPAQAAAISTGLGIGLDPLTWAAVGAVGPALGKAGLIGTGISTLVGAGYGAAEALGHGADPTLAIGTGALELGLLTFLTHGSNAPEVAREAQTVWERARGLRLPADPSEVGLLRAAARAISPEATAQAIENSAQGFASTLTGVRALGRDVEADRFLQTVAENVRAGRRTPRLAARPSADVANGPRPETSLAVPESRLGAVVRDGPLVTPPPAAAPVRRALGAPDRPLLHEVAAHDGSRYRTVGEAEAALPGYRARLKATHPESRLADSVRFTLAQLEGGILRARQAEAARGIVPSRFRHGTGRVFDRYDPGRIAQHGDAGPGLYGSTDADEAYGYAQTGVGGGDAEGYQVYNPAEFASAARALEAVVPRARLTAPDTVEEFVGAQSFMDWPEWQDELARVVARRGRIPLRQARPLVAEHFPLPEMAPNVRSFDVAPDELLDDRTPLDPRVVERVAAALSPEHAARLSEELAKYPPETAHLQQALLNVLYRDGGMAAVNRTLAQAGFTGLLHNQGRHVVIFPEHLGRITNAYSGAAGAMTAEDVGRFGGPTLAGDLGRTRAPPSAGGGGGFGGLTLDEPPPAETARQRLANDLGTWQPRITGGGAPAASAMQIAQPTPTPVSVLPVGGAAPGMGDVFERGLNPAQQQVQPPLPLPSHLGEYRPPSGLATPYMGYEPGDMGWAVEQLFNGHSATQGGAKQPAVPSAELYALRGFDKTVSFPREVSELRRALLTGWTGSAWYRQAMRTLVPLVGWQNRQELAAVLSVLSPGADWRENVAGAIGVLRAIREMDAGGQLDWSQIAGMKPRQVATTPLFAEFFRRVKEIPGVEKPKGYYILPENFAKALMGYRDGGILQAENAKTSTFFTNFMTAYLRMYDPNSTMDKWMSWLFGTIRDQNDTRYAGSNNWYRTGEAITARLGREVGLQPNEAQAALWVVIKTLMEEPEILEGIKAGKTLTWALDRAQVKQLIPPDLGRGMTPALQLERTRQQIRAWRAGGYAARQPVQMGEGLELLHPGVYQPKAGLKGKPVNINRTFKGAVYGELQAPSASVATGADALGALGYAAARGDIPWITPLHRVDVQGDRVTLSFPGADDATTTLYGAALGHALGAPSVQFSMPRAVSTAEEAALARGEDVAVGSGGVWITGDERQIGQVRAGLAANAIPVVSTSQPTAIQVPFAGLAAADQGGVNTALRGILDEAGLDPSRVTVYAAEEWAHGPQDFVGLLGAAWGSVGRLGTSGLRRGHAQRIAADLERQRLLRARQSAAGTGGGPGVAGATPPGVQPSDGGGAAAAGEGEAGAVAGPRAAGLAPDLGGGGFGGLTLDEPPPAETGLQMLANDLGTWRPRITGGGQVAPWQMTRAAFEATGQHLLHGTTRPFARFDPQAATNRYGKPVRNAAFYFTDRPDVARKLSTASGNRAVDLDAWMADNGVDDAAEALPQLKAALEGALAQGRSLWHADPATGQVVRLPNAAALPDAALLDGESVYLFAAGREPRTIGTRVYGRTLDLTDPTAIPADLRRILEPTNYHPWDAGVAGFEHEYTPELIDYARTHGYGKITVADVMESGGRSTLGVPEYIGHGRDPHRAFVEQALARGEAVPPEVLRDYPDLGVTGGGWGGMTLDAPPPSETGLQGLANLVGTLNPRIRGGGLAGGAGGRRGVPPVPPRPPAPPPPPSPARQVVSAALEGGHVLRAYNAADVMSNPASQFRNITGSVLSMATQPIESELAAASFGLAARLARQSGAARTRYGRTEIKAATLGSLRGASDGFNTAMEVWAHGETRLPTDWGKAMASGDLSDLSSLTGGGRTVVRDLPMFQTAAQRRVSGRGRVANLAAALATPITAPLNYTVLRPMTAADEFFKGMLYNGAVATEFYRLARSRGLTGVAADADVTTQYRILHDPPAATAHLPLTGDTLAAVKRAGKYARYQTYQQEMDRIGTALSSVQKLPLLGSFLLTFTRTPWNILKYGLERSPAAIASIGVDVARGVYDPSSAFGTAHPEQVREVGDLADRLGRFWLGVGFCVATIGLWQTGILTGAAPTDPGEAKAWRRAGHKEFSIHVPGTDIHVPMLSIPSLGPTMAMTVGVLDAHAKWVAHAREHPEEPPPSLLEMGAQAFDGAVASMQQIGFAQSWETLATVIDAAAGRQGSPAENLQAPLTRIGSNIAVGLTPGSAALRALTSAGGSVVGDVYERQTPGVLDDARALLPPALGALGLPNASDLPPQEVLGRPIPRQQRSPWDTLFNPLSVVQDRQDALDRELALLGISVPGVGSTVEGQRLTTAQRQAYEAATGRAARPSFSGIPTPGLDQLLADPDYQALPPERRKAVMTKAIDAARATGRTALLASGEPGLPTLRDEAAGEPPRYDVAYLLPSIQTQYPLPQELYDRYLANPDAFDAAVQQAHEQIARWRAGPAEVPAPPDYVFVLSNQYRNRTPEWRAWARARRDQGQADDAILDALPPPD